MVGMGMGMGMGLAELKVVPIVHTGRDSVKGEGSWGTSAMVAIGFIIIIVFGVGVRSVYTIKPLMLTSNIPLYYLTYRPTFRPRSFLLRTSPHQSTLTHLFYVPFHIGKLSKKV